MLLAIRGFFYISLRYVSGAPSNVIVAQRCEPCVTALAHMRNRARPSLGPTFDCSAPKPDARVYQSLACCASRRSLESLSRNTNPLNTL